MEEGGKGREGRWGWDGRRSEERGQEGMRPGQTRLLERSSDGPLHLLPSSRRTTQVQSSLQYSERPRTPK